MKKWVFIFQRGYYVIDGIYQKKRQMQQYLGWSTHF